MTNARMFAVISVCALAAAAAMIFTVPNGPEGLRVSYIFVATTLGIFGCICVGVAAFFADNEDV